MSQPEGMQQTGRPAGPGLTTDAARQGVTTGRVRWVLVVSIVLAVVAMAFVFFEFAH